MPYGCKRIVLATSDTTTRDMARIALAGKYSLLAFPNAEKLIQHAEQSARPDLILFSGGLETLGQLKAGLATRHVPLIFLTKPGDMEGERAALAMGAADCVQSTASPQLLRRRVDLQVGAGGRAGAKTAVQQTGARMGAREDARLKAQAGIRAGVRTVGQGGALTSAHSGALTGVHSGAQTAVAAGVQTAMAPGVQTAAPAGAQTIAAPGSQAIASPGAHELALSMVVELVECRDGMTRGHIDRTGLYMQALADGMAAEGVYLDELNALDAETLCLASKLHDLGKVGIRDSILRKPSSLTLEEYEEMKKHTTLGEEVIDRMQRRRDEGSFFELARVCAGTHHERWDGGGYPRGLRGDDIPLAGRMMAIVDVYDALVSKRPYKPAYPLDLAARLIADESGRHFDPAIVGVFISCLRRFESIASGDGDGDSDSDSDSDGLGVGGFGGGRDGVADVGGGSGGGGNDNDSDSDCRAIACTA